jgi:hypothetical protein
MADINQVITLGIGTPADIKHFILLGLNVGAETPITGAGEVRTIYAQSIETIEAQSLPYIRASRTRDIEA